jgi:hypothetical protein
MTVQKDSHLRQTGRSKKERALALIGDAFGLDIEVER